MSLMIFLEFESGALHELEQVRGLINVFGSFNYRNRLAPLLVVVLLLCSRQLPTTFDAGVLTMLRATPLGWHERPRGLPRVEIASETALPHQAVDSGWVAVALSLVPNRLSRQEKWWWQRPQMNLALGRLPMCHCNSRCLRGPPLNLIDGCLPMPGLR